MFKFVILKGLYYYKHLPKMNSFFVLLLMYSSCRVEGTKHNNKLNRILKERWPISTFTVGNKKVIKKYWKIASLSVIFKGFTLGGALLQNDSYFSPLNRWYYFVQNIIITDKINRTNHSFRFSKNNEIGKNSLY